jgi:hypothetical protein
MLRQQAREQVSKEQVQKPQSPVRKGEYEAKLLPHCSFTKIIKNFQQATTAAAVAATSTTTTNNTTTTTTILILTTTTTTTQNASGENKGGSNAVTSHSTMKRNMPGDSPSPLFFCIALIPLMRDQNRADCGYQVHGAERKISHLPYMDDLKLVSKSEQDLENEIKIVKAISKDIYMNSGSQKCAKFCFKKATVQTKTYKESTSEKDIKDLDLRQE